tara:strand:- start:1141 stop:1407 length:267 start_codon:yes stop_codon:yes gene_type:complete
MLDFLVEFLGTFIFLSVIIITGNPLAIGLTLSSMAWFGGKISGGHYNPAVTYMMFLNKKINLQKVLFYILAQILGAISAYFLYKNIKN